MAVDFIALDTCGPISLGAVEHFPSIPMAMVTGTLFSSPFTFSIVSSSTTGTHLLTPFLHLPFMDMYILI